MPLRYFGQITTFSSQKWQKLSLIALLMALPDSKNKLNWPMPLSSIFFRIWCYQQVSILRKYVQIFVHGRHLLRKANTFKSSAPGKL